MDNKFISPLIASQFPQFYNEDGPTFIAFVKAYYEWMEQQGNIINQSRSLLDTMDIDKTEKQFINHFTNTYLLSLPQDIITDKRLVVKHILDLYRTKGTKRAYELLFRLLFNEDIEIYVPSQYILKPSDNTWNIPHYIEVSGGAANPNLQYLIGHQVYNSSRTAQAVVEAVYAKVEQNRIINVLYLNSVQGRFKYGEILLSDLVDLNGNILFKLGDEGGNGGNNSPIIVTGSLTAVAIENGGYGFNKGDIVSIQGSGSGGQARIVSTVDENGKVVFTLLNGGSGFSLNALVTVKPALNLTINTPSGTFNKNDTITDKTTGATATVGFANSTFIQAVDFTGTFNSGDSISNNAGSSAYITSVSGGGGSGASFNVGGLTNKEIYYINTDIINTEYSTNLETLGMSIGVNSETGSFTVGNNVLSTANVVVLDCITNIGGVSNGEVLSNTSISSPVPGVYAYRSEGSLIWVTASTDGAFANLVPGLILNSSISSSQVQINAVYPKQVITGSGVISAQTTSTITLSSTAGWIGTFNANTNVIGNAIVTGSANTPYYTNGSIVSYNVYAGNTVISGLNNGTSYSIRTINSTAVSLAPRTPYGIALNSNTQINNNFINVPATTARVNQNVPYYFVNNDIVTYYTLPGVSVISGLTNNQSYYVVNANTTIGAANVGQFQLSTTSGGSPLSIVADSTLYPGHVLIDNVMSLTASTINESGHSLTLSSGYFIPSKTLTDIATGHTANVLTTNTSTIGVSRSTSWAAFPKVVSSGPNLDNNIGDVLTWIQLQTGTITYLSNINPGFGYSANPYVDVIEPVVYALGQSDGAGGIKGHNAFVNAVATNAAGIVTAAAITDSGFGYIPGETVSLHSLDTTNQTVVTGSAVIDLDGIGTGSWKNDKSYVSDINKLQDSNFYQDYSYQIIAQRMFNTYEKFVRDIVHPSGVALFGKFGLKSYLVDSESVASEFTISQAQLVDNNTYYYLTDESNNIMLDEYNDYLEDYAYIPNHGFVGVYDDNANIIDYTLMDEFGNYLEDEFTEPLISEVNVGI